MSDRNPFDETPTVIRPNPGGRRPAADQAAPPPLFATPSAENVAIPVDAATGLGFGPVVAAGGPLLSLAGWLGHAPAQRDSAALRQRLLSELQAFDAAARGAGQSELAVRQADYIICATLDDVIANTEWGRELDWSRQSLARTRHNDATGGDQVFRLIEDYRRDPVNNFPCLELVYFCLSLGFEGRMRVLQAGDAEHLRLREDLLRIMRQLRGPSPEILSPRWRGAGGGPRPAISVVPLWVIGVVAAAILSASYVGLLFWLGDQSNEVHRQLAGLPPTQPMTVAPVRLVVTRQSQQIKHFLEDEIARNLVSVDDDGRNTRVRIVGTGMFASGSASLDDGFLPLIRDLANALVATEGRILVTGHTDNQLIRHNIRFHDNDELSKARADTVRALIIENQPGLQSRIDAEGRAEREPVNPAESQDTSEARQRNRRIDLIVPHQVEEEE